MTLKVMCARALTEVVNAVVRDFIAGGEQQVSITYGTVGALQAKLDEIGRAHV